MTEDQLKVLSQRYKNKEKIPAVDGDHTIACFIRMAASKFPICSCVQDTVLDFGALLCLSLMVEAEHDEARG